MEEELEGIRAAIEAIMDELTAKKDGNKVDGA